MTTTTKTIREIQYIGPDGQPLEYVPTSTSAGQAITHHPRLSTSSTGGGGGGYEGYPPSIENRSASTTAQPAFVGGQPGQSGGPQQAYANYAEYPHRPPTPPSPSDRSNSPPPQHREPGRIFILSKSFLRIYHFRNIFTIAIFVDFQESYMELPEKRNTFCNDFIYIGSFLKFLFCLRLCKFKKTFSTQSIML